MAATNGNASNDFTVKVGLAQMLKGGVIMDVVNAEQVIRRRILRGDLRYADKTLSPL